MKRIVQCPKCQAKLSVVDLGKPLKQKCPKCGELFVIESEEAKAVDAKKEPSAEAAPVSATPEAKAESQAAAPEAKQESMPEAKENAAPKPAPRPAAPRPLPAPAPEPEFSVHHSGVSFLHIVVIIGLLILVIVMQVMAKKNAEKRFNSLETQLSDVHKALSSQILKSR